MTRYACLIALLLAVGGVPTARARYIRQEIETVPTVRLITNLEARVTADPKNLQVRYQLGRVHSIAYATRSSQFEVLARGGEPYFGVGTHQDFPPAAVVRPGSDGTKPKDPTPPGDATARVHLQQAIAQFQAVTRADTNHHFGYLGLGWCLDQSGDRNGALAAYRQALLLASRLEEKAAGIESGGCITEEVARYLLKLLDPVRDAEEIRQVQARVKSLEKKGRWITPIFVPLADDLALAELVDPGARVRFDLDGSGLERSWGWITPRAAWLVYDPAARGEISSGLQLFGNVTFWTFWSDGYEAMASLDDNRDGELREGELAGLALWQDRNGNGVSEPGEVRPLAAWDIVALGCSREPHPAGFPYNPRGVVRRDGSTRPSFDWIVPGR